MSNNFQKRSVVTDKLDSGPYLARVVSNLDPFYMGTLTVELAHPIGNQPERQGQLVYARYLSPFYGVTPLEFTGPAAGYNSTQKSYGMWMVPPDVGTIVMVIFVRGQIGDCYWIGCVPEPVTNFMIPGIAATKFHNDGISKKVPVAEYNKKGPDQFTNDSTSTLKPQHPLADALKLQGLLEDEIRGITTSSARRESPSHVFGISTPGPKDKRNGALKGNVGRKDQKANIFVSRLGGSTFVMDDGDERWIRKTKASEGPPEYINVIAGGTGDVTTPHNELVRIRTRTGHQILLHNSEDLIYIGNSRGTAWIELTSDGKMDIYCEDSVSIHSNNDVNIRADRDINFEALRDVNIKAGNSVQNEAVKEVNLLAGTDTKISSAQNLHLNTQQTTFIGSGSNINIKSDADNLFTAGGSTNILSSGEHLEQATRIHMNGPTPATAADSSAVTPLKTHSLPDVGTSIMNRAPTHEPYKHHENLDPKAFRPQYTDRRADDIPAKNSYSIPDTFDKKL